MGDSNLGDGPRVVALVRDLMFAARVRGAAPEAVVVQKAGELVPALGVATRLVLVDLQAPGAQDAIEAVTGEGAPRVVAFGPHVMERELAAAREAGAEVLPRGAFVKRLPSLVSEASG